MQTTITRPSALPLVNDDQANGWSNRLTVFRDGDVRIEEIHQSNRGSISRMEFEGDAISCALPGVVFESDIESINTWIENRSFEEIKDFLKDQPIEAAVDFYDDYAHGWYHEIATDEEMWGLVAQHGRDAGAIENAIREGGADFVALEDWIESWLDNNPADE